MACKDSFHQCSKHERGSREGPAAEEPVPTAFDCPPTRFLNTQRDEMLQALFPNVNEVCGVWGALLEQRHRVQDNVVGSVR